MSSLFATSKLSGAIKPGLLFHRTRGATKVASCVSPATQISLFRNAAQQQTQAGLARAPEPEYVPEHILQDLPAKFTHHLVTPNTTIQSVEDVLKNGGGGKVQEVPKSVADATSPQPSIDLATVPAYHRGSKFGRVPYWHKIGRWKDISEKQFLSYRWGVSQTIFAHRNLLTSQTDRK